MASNTYTCAMCGDTFERVRPHEEAAAEFAEMFPGEDIADAAVVCDDCWQSMTSIIPPPGAGVRLTIDGAMDIPEVAEWLKELEKKISSALLWGNDGV